MTWTHGSWSESQARSYWIASNRKHTRRYANAGAVLGSGFFRSCACVCLWQVRTEAGACSAVGAFRRASPLSVLKSASLRSTILPIAQATLGPALLSRARLVFRVRRVRFFSPNHAVHARPFPQLLLAWIVIVGASANAVADDMRLPATVQF